MSLWQEGDILGPTNLNNKGSSANSSGGFSSNTLRPESGDTIVLSQGTGIGVHVILDMRTSPLVLRSIPSSASASNFYDGELYLFNVSATSASLGFRSGNTLFIFNAVATSI